MMKKLLVLVFLLLSPVVYAEDELLPPEQAFSVGGRVIDANTVEIEWNVADGYYMYHDKFNFTSKTPGIELGEAQIPQGKKKFDEIFGKELETHRHKVAVRVPLNRTTGVTTLQLVAGSQGCADIGVCYPPLKQTVLLNLPAATTATQAATEKKSTGGLKKITSLGNSLGLGGEQEFLSPDEAFMFNARMGADGNIVADWQIADGYYLYREKFAFSSNTAGVSLGTAAMPAGEMHTGIRPDGSEGDVEVYMHGVQINVPVQRTDNSVQTLNFVAEYQGCAEAGICYPPTTKTISLSLPASLATSTTAPAVTTTDTTSADADKGYLWYILAAFAVGVGLTFTPCVLPMVPILSSIIVGQSKDGQITKMKGGMLSTSYVLGTSVIYTSAGVFAGYSGGQLQAYFQNPWLIGGVAIILVLLAMSMFGLFTIQMPAAIQSRLQSSSANIKGGSFIGVFIMGILSSMIVGACASPLLLGVLLAAIESQDPLLGGLIMFSMSWGMGVILIAIGIGAGAIIPKAGTWMDKVKYFFGVLLIGVAIYIMQVLPGVPVLLLWGIFLVTLGVYLGATQTLPEACGGWRMFWKGVGTVLLIWGVLALLGGIQGNRDIMKPIDFSAISVPTSDGQHSDTTADAHSLFTQIKSIADFDREMAAAKAAGKPVMIDFFATWCTDCIRMEKSSFIDPKARQAMDKFVLLQVDVTDPNNADTSAVQKKLGVYGPPAILFFKADGSANKAFNFYGYKGPDEFAAHLNNALQS
jgi:thiol:disulfide interchange protein DsbD